MSRRLRQELEEYGHFLLMTGIILHRGHHNAKKRKHRWWVHEKRSEHGAYYYLVAELELDEEQFQHYFRLTREQFKQALYLEESVVKVCKTREAICPRQ
ncbi:putative nuclease HARBI1-like 23 [Homarus americanus]|uniref:Putative nuclease HARBI1-like 23 n=1 Tax=Homarus americanus TaxID=6706 RepID=A0A8J5JJ75_HOMAM|nr:putative nuclease HARBI1-like 23 [Homarus americanus]